MTLTGKVLSLTEEQSAVRAERVNLRHDLDKMITLVQRRKNDVRSSLSTVSTKVEKRNNDMVAFSTRKI